MAHFENGVGGEVGHDPVQVVLIEGRRDRFEHPHAVFVVHESHLLRLRLGRRGYPTHASSRGLEGQVTSVDHIPGERLLPGKERVVDLDRAGADLDGAVHTSGGIPTSP